MPFRRHEQQGICAVCKALCSSFCLRCNKPLCRDHAPSPETRCESCELDYAKRKDEIMHAAATDSVCREIRLRASYLGAKAILFPAIVALVYFGACELASCYRGTYEDLVALGVSAIGLPFIFLVGVWQDRELRRQFLLERKDALPCPSVPNRTAKPASS